jgi:hypothetical protein
MRATLVTIVMLFALAQSALAQQCGDPPRVDDQMLKAEIEGKAKFLSSLVGDAGLKGQVEMAKADIFSKYPNADKLHSDTYLLYMFCTFVLSDAKLSVQDKLQAILNLQKALLPSASLSVTTTGPQSPIIIDSKGGVAVGRDIVNSPITINPSLQPENGVLAVQTVFFATNALSAEDAYNVIFPATDLILSVRLIKVPAQVSDLRSPN